MTNDTYTLANALLDSIGSDLPDIDALSNYISSHKSTLLDPFGGGQGLQSLIAIGAELYRQDRQNAEDKKKRTVLTILAERVAKATSRLLDGEIDTMDEALAQILPKAAEALRRANIHTLRDLILKAMTDQPLARELLVRQDGDIVPNGVQARIAEKLGP